MNWKDFIGLLVLTCFCIFVLLMLPIENPLNTTACDMRSWFDSDKYSYNAENRSDWFSCGIGSLEKDNERRERNAEQKAKNHQAYLIRKACFDSGQNVTIENQDLREDYGFSCEQIAYINDHLIHGTEKVDAGKTTTTSVSRGLFHYTRTTTASQHYAWIDKYNLATGALLKNATFHLDCQNSTLFHSARTKCEGGTYWDYNHKENYCRSSKKERPDTLEASYYTEADFVLYYVDHCLKEASE